MQRDLDYYQEELILEEGMEKVRSKRDTGDKS